jgi:dTDP-4-dehydrorhamnose 3,5-epimerase
VILNLFCGKELDQEVPYKEQHIVGESNPVAVIITPRIVQAYKNISSGPGIVFNAPNRLFAGPGKCYPIDEIRHETTNQESFVV